MYDIGGYTEAKTVDEVIELLKNNDNALIISGGTDVLIKARERKSGYVGRDLIGITRIPELMGVKMNSDESIIIGPATTFSGVEKNEIIAKNLNNLSYAVGTVGGPQTRNAGTIGGNICNGATSADSASTLFAYNASVIIKGINGERELPISEFYLGPGKVALEHSDVLVGIKIKKEDYHGYKGHYIKFSPRKAMDIATLGCSVLIKENNGVIEDLRIAFGVAGPTPIRVNNAEEYAKGKTISPEVLDKIGELCLENSRARDSWRASKAFREQLIKELPKKAIMISSGGK
ncbi:MAG: xanthine dehydrogenase FAD-binding subunit XdhB [Sebaldella sp.]|nr:xanthine dehydrogenase FAD-binding subunit XdhB [Sebaldella sp.]